MPKQIVIGQRVSDSKVEASRLMRRDMTPTETILWARLRNRQVGGAKFRRQQIINGFIADFYCHEQALVVEVDGETHEEQQDRERDAVFAGRGIITLRFQNREVADQLESVVDRIAKNLTSG